MDKKTYFGANGLNTLLDNIKNEFDGVKDDIDTCLTFDVEGEIDIEE